MYNYHAQQNDLTYYYNKETKEVPEAKFNTTGLYEITYLNQTDQKNITCYYERKDREATDMDKKMLND